MRVSADFSLGHDAEHVIDQDVQLVARADLHTEQDYGLVQAGSACSNMRHHEMHERAVRMRAGVHSFGGFAGARCQ